MKKSIILIIFLVSKIVSYGKSGGEITYQSIGNNKYDVYFKIFRDCRGVTEINTTFSFGIYSSSDNNSLSIKPSLISIRDISTSCLTAAKCNPSNTQISTTFPIFEEHIYKYTVDFNGNESSFKSYCLLKLFMSRCCRSGSITTGPKNYDFFITTDFNLCKVKSNSSPVFLSLPIFIVSVNQPAYLCFSAIDTIDKDSLSYSYTEPLQSISSAVKWSSGFAYNKPLTIYWPTGYDKTKGPNPSVNPPIGLFLDPEIGQLIFTPIDSNEVTIICIAVKEWRKDSTGKYQQIGEIRRDITLFVKNLKYNNPPLLYGPYVYKVCPNEKLCFTISSDDKQFIPPPPAKPNAPDTVTLTWSTGINKSGTFKIVDSTSRLQKGQFCWIPKESDARDLPYIFTVTARDNSCPMNAATTKPYLVFVKTKAKAIRDKKFIKNGLYEFKSLQDIGFKGSPTYFWEIYDSTMKLVDTAYYFHPSNSLKSNRQLDSVQFYNGGKYIIHHRINNPPLNCPTDYFDTLKVAPVTPILRINPNGIIEKWECQNRMDTLFPIVRNAKKPVKYRWSSSSSDTLPYLIINNKRDSSYRVDVYDGAGFHRSAEWKIYLYQEPKLLEKDDISMCSGDTISISGTATNFTDTVYWKWFYNGNALSTDQNIRVSKTGIYSLKISDTTKCFSKVDTIMVSNMIVTGRVIEKIACLGDSVSISDTASGMSGILCNKWFYRGTQISTGSSIQVFQRGKYILEISDSNKCLTKRDTIELSDMVVNAASGMVKKVCKGDVMMLYAAGADTSGGNKGKYFWYINSLSNLMDSGSLVTYKFKTDNTMVVKLLQTKGSLTCSDLDTLNVEFRPLPQITFKNGTICQNETELDLHTLILKPTNSYTGIVSWQLLKTLQKPGGANNSITDLVYDKDNTSSDHYYLKVDKSTIDLKPRFMDSVMLGLTYKDEFGCQNSSSNGAIIVIRSNVDVLFNTNEQKRCYGDSVIYISNDYGVNYYGGRWFTNNDSSNYSKWPQGNIVQLYEKLGTKSLDPKGGKYLMKYVLENNKCLSYKSAILTIIPYPAIVWAQTDQGDSVILTDKSTNAERREWYINSKKMSEASLLTVSKSDAKIKEIVIKVFNSNCETDSVIVPKITFGINKINPQKFVLYPNPVSKILTIESGLLQPYQLKIVNSLGQIVITKSMDLSDDTIDVAQLCEGVYTLEILDDATTSRLRFIKN